MYFTENRYDRSIESMMKGIPNFYPRGSGIVVTGRFEYTADMCDCRLCEHYGGKLRDCKVPRCVCLEERIAVGVASLKEVMKETMSEIKHSGFLRRLRKYIKESEVIPMTFLSEQHRLSFNAALDRIGKYDTKNHALVAALYLLTADFRLWNQRDDMSRTTASASANSVRRTALSIPIPSTARRRICISVPSTSPSTILPTIS